MASIIQTFPKGSGSGGGHTIQDSEGITLAQRHTLQFSGDIEASDDTQNSKTLVEPHELTNEELVEIMSTIPVNPSSTYMPSTGFTPVGTVISFMGTTAPRYYLACDGTIYNIIQYPVLAKFFKDQFGSENYFGGDGITTFAVPDLRGEFLRGTGTNGHTGQGSGENVGDHQDASAVRHWHVSDGTTNAYLRVGNKYYGESVVLPNDGAVNPTGSTSFSNIKITGTTTTTGASSTSYNVRPTNTSVLYCIAYQNIYIDAKYNYSEDEQIVGTWIDGKPIYQKTISIGSLPNNGEKTTETGISDIDLVIECIGFSYSSTVRRPLPYVYTNATLLNGVWVQQDNSVWSIHCRTGTDHTNENAYITLKYTKTTD